ncbi:LacI family DNA-binding transcriptional regulator [Cellulomonas sp. 179-A 9B4 NHS]|uniref:LacI family DNA-binding transcriptional regulator n=1 Tax=Cellulomonas sp. 179-A 9B4 NHS TaxID=3142379 RepID=UPI0039A12355
MSTPRVTSRDVARRAGVSQSTVSYVLNDTPGQAISAETRARVLDAAAELAYTPSAAARALRAGRTDTVLVVLADIPVGDTALAIVGALSRTIRPHGYTTVYQRRDGRDLRTVLRSVTPVAIADVGAFSPDEIAAAVERNVPVVGVSLDGVDGHVMRIPQDEIGRMQAEHLIARGRRRLAYAASDDPDAHDLTAGRIEGVRAACARHGLPAPVVVETPLYADAAARAVDRLRNRADPVTGVCAFDDEVALAVLAGMRLGGLSAPADVAVVGVDDVPLARLVSPALTTVHVRSDDVGAALGRHVLRRLKPELGIAEPDDQATVHLVVRETT